MAEMRFTDEQLARALRGIGRAVEWPETPPITTGVLVRVDEARSLRADVGRRRPSASTWWTGRRIAISAAAALALVLAVGLAARLVIGSAEIRVQPRSTPTGPRPDLDALGERVPLARARLAVDFPLRLPPGPPPDEVYVFETPDGTTGSLLAWTPGDQAFGPRLPGTPWSLVLVEVRSSAEVLVKDVIRFEDVTEVVVDGHGAFWIDAPHELHVATAEATASSRVDGNVLIWERGDVTLRIETSLSLRDAIALAESLE